MAWGERVPGGSVADLGFARVDLTREERTGFPEAIFCPGKTPREIREIARALLERTSSPVILTRAGSRVFKEVRHLSPEASYHPRARLAVLRRHQGPPLGTLGVLAAGTSDLPVAEEAAITAEACGAQVLRAYDVGVAGLHRLLAEADLIARADALVVVAGADAALASVVAGLTPRPVVAVPTSAGVSPGLPGLAPLLSMIAACSPGVAVVGVDNGFGAAAFAIRLLKARGEGTD